MTSTPRKLNTAAMAMAAPAFIARVDTQVAMALGASVQPLTRITPIVNSAVMASIGLEPSIEANSVRLTLMRLTTSSSVV